MVQTFYFITSALQTVATLTHFWFGQLHLCYAFSRFSHFACNYCNFEIFSGAVKYHDHLVIAQVANEDSDFVRTEVYFE